MRRIAVENAAVVARQAVLARVGSDAAPAVSVNLEGGWGNVSIAESAGRPLHAETKADGWNHFNWGNGDGYSYNVVAQIEVPVPLSEGLKERSVSEVESPPGLETARIFRIRSRSPVLSGDLFIVNRTAAGLGIDGSIQVNGRVVVWEPASSVAGSVSVQNYAARTPLELTGVFSNFPFPPVTSGWVGGNLADAYAGWLNVVANGTNTNCLAQKALESAIAPIDGLQEIDTGGVKCEADGIVRVDLLDPALGNLTINNHVDTLVLQGQASDADFVNAGEYRAVLIVVNETAGDTLRTIRLTNRNNRKIVVAVKKAAGTAVNFDFPDATAGAWRGIFTLENTPASWNPVGATLALYGGIQTDRSLSVTGPGMSIHPEVAPMLLERITARDAWVEAYAMKEDDE